MGIGKVLESLFKFNSQHLHKKMGDDKCFRSHTKQAETEAPVEPVQAIPQA